MNVCPSRLELDSFQAGNLDDAESASLESHIEGCSTCQKSLETVIGESADNVLAALLEAAEPDTFASEASCRTAVQRVTALARELSAGGGTEATIASVPGSGNETPGGPLPVESIREYKLLAKLGEGGMGAVYKALHTRLDKVVALKVLPAERMRDTGAVARFQREMKAVGKLDHPNIVRAMDAGEEAGMHFLVMEYVEGLDLSQLAKNTGPLPIADACELVRQAALGLAEAHEHGMVHRDIKPSNLILAKSRKKSGQPTVKILDLGLALLSEALAPDAGGLTTSGQMMGTIDYMAPEQGGDSHQVDIRADIYSLGATLYRLLTGSAPFAGEKFDTPVKKLMALATQSPTSSRSLRPDIPAPLAAVLDKMLAKSPAARFATPEELTEALAPFCKNANLAALLARASAPARPTSAPASEIGTQNHLSSPSGDTAPTIDRVPAPLSPRGRGAGGEGAVSAKQEPRPLVAALGGGNVRRVASIAIACGAAALAVLLGITFYIQTQQGTIQVEINDPAIKVTLDNDGNTVFQGVEKKHELKLKPGPHGMTITRGDFSFATTQFELKRKEVVVLSIKYLPGRIQITDASGKVRDERTLPTYALQFDGVDDYVELPTLKFDGTHAFTMEIWAEVENGRDSPQLLHYSGVPGRRAKIQLGVPLVPDRPNLMSAVTAGPAQQPHQNPEYAALRFDENFEAGLQHVALCWSPDGSTSLYWNGRRCPNPALLDRSKSWPTGTSSMIGANPRADGTRHQFLKGTIRQVRFSKGVRYASEFSPDTDLKPDANTLALYHFDEGEGDVLKDSSGHNHHGKIVGAKWIGKESLSSSPANAVKWALDFGEWANDKFSTCVDIPYAMPPQGSFTVELFATPRSVADVDSILWHQHGNWLLKLTGTDPSNGGAISLLAGLGRAKYDGIAKSHHARPGQRTHLAFTTDGKVMSLYADGNFVDSKALTRTLPIEPLTSQLGGTNRDGAGVNTPFKGTIDGLRISRGVRYANNFRPPGELSKDADTLVLYRFDDGSGDVLRDSSGNHYHGKILGAKWVRTDSTPLLRSNSALQFDGIDDHVLIPDLVARDTEVLTYECWLEAAAKPDMSLASIPRPDGKGLWRVAIQKGGPYAVRVGGEKYGIMMSASGSLPAESLIHFAAVYHKDQWTLWINGKRVAKGGSHNAWTPSIRKLFTATIGSDEGVPVSGVHPKPPFQGRLHQMRISSSKRYEEEFVPEPKFGMDQDTLALYRFDEGHGDVLKDSSGNGHHGKIVGAKWVQIDRAFSPLIRQWGLDFAFQTQTENAKVVLPFRLAASDPVTVEMYVTPRSVTDHDHPLFLTSYGTALLKQGGQWWCFGGTLGTKEKPNQLRTPLQVGRRVHLAGVATGSMVELFVGGNSIGKTPVVLPFRANGEFCSLGGLETKLKGWAPFDGTIDQVRISTTARYDRNFVPAAEFEADADTLALYHFDEGQGDVLTDSSGHNHHGKIVGAKWVQVDAEGSATAPVIVQKLPSGGYEAVAPGYRVQLAATGLIEKVEAGSTTLIESTAYGRMGTSMPAKVEAKHDGTTLTFTEGDDYRLIYEFGPKGFAVKTRVSTAAAQRDGPDGKPYYLIHQTRFPKSAQRVRPLDGMVPFALPATSFEESYTNHFVVDFSDGSQIEVKCDQPSEHSGFLWTEGPYTWGRTNLKSDADHEIRFDIRPPGQAVGWHGWPADAPPPAIAPFDTTQAKAHQDAWAKHLGVPVEYENSIGMKFRLVPPGEYIRGSTAEEIAAAVKAAGGGEHWKQVIESEGPRHRVTLTQPIFLSVHEVTQAQFKQVMGSNPSHFAASGGGKEAVQGQNTSAHPVDSVRWNDAAEFCVKLSAHEKFQPLYARAADSFDPVPGAGYRLPTEAEWEFSCRGGTTTRYWVGDQVEQALQAGWYASNAGGRTHAVGELEANPFGLFDVYGNVGEWCQDRWQESAYAEFAAQPARDPVVLQAPGSGRVVRGGYWGHSPALFASASRLPGDVNLTGNNAGFRVALTVDAVRDALAKRPTSAVAPFDAVQAKQHQEAWAKYLGVPAEWENSLGMKFRLVPPGEFMIGASQQEVDELAKAPGLEAEHWQACVRSMQPQRRVRLTRPVYLGVHEVTQAQYEAVTKARPSLFAAKGEHEARVADLDTAQHPVENVNWHDAVAFCAKLSQQEKLAAAAYRLPSEAEAEWACRAGTTTLFWTGDTDESLATGGWFANNSGGRTHRVGELAPNPLGLYDTHGNVWEWTSDWWNSSYPEMTGDSSLTDPTGPASGTERAVRGGDWYSPSTFSRSAFRNSNDPFFHNASVGFRVALPVEAVREAIAQPKP